MNPVRAVLDERTGDPGPTFEDVYDEYFDFVWRSVRRLGVEAPDVRDVIQEVFVVVHRKLWPRSLFGPPTEPADQETLTALAKVELALEKPRATDELLALGHAARHLRTALIELGIKPRTTGDGLQAEERP